MWLYMAIGFVGLSVLAVALAYVALIVFTPTTLPRSQSETQYLSSRNPSTPLPLIPLTEPASISLSIIVPAYNERERLGEMIEEAMEYFLSASSSSAATSKGKREIKPEWFSKGVEILVVDDGSKDDTSQIAVELSARWEKQIKDRRKETGVEGTDAFDIQTRVITLERNRGKGGAVRHGVMFARGERILFADADGASKFTDLTLLLSAVDSLTSPSPSPSSSSSSSSFSKESKSNGTANGVALKGAGHSRRKSLDGMFARKANGRELRGHGLVAGSRAHLEKSEAVVKRSFVRNLLMHGFHIFVRTLGVSGIRDTQCGFKLFTRKTALALFPTLHLHRWSFDVELLLLASLIGIPVAEVPIDWHEVAGSKISVGWDGIGMARDLLVLRGNLLLGRWRVPELPKEGEGEDS